MSVSIANTTTTHIFEEITSHETLFRKNSDSGFDDLHKPFSARKKKLNRKEFFKKIHERLDKIAALKNADQNQEDTDDEDQFDKILKYSGDYDFGIITCKCGLYYNIYESCCSESENEPEF